MPKVIRTPGPGKEQLKFLLDGLDTNLVGKVGWFETSKYEDGTPVAYVATIQEYGSPAQNIPPRPFMRPTIKARINYWREIAKRGAESLLKGGTDMDKIFNQIGLAASGDIRKTITQITTPPLAASTIKSRIRRGLNPSKPLEATKKMISELTYTVESE